MAFRFEKASCVVVGTFNMYILHPQWLADHGIIEKGTEVAIETNFSRPGFRFHIQRYGGIWSIAPDRVAIESKSRERDCGYVIANVLQALPETPLFAIGNNTTYMADLAERDRLIAVIRDFPLTESPKEDETVVQRTFHTAVRRGNQKTTNLQLSIKEEGIELSCNVHTKLDGHSDANAAAVNAAKCFYEDRRGSESLARHFWGALIEHGTDDT